MTVAAAGNWGALGSPKDEEPKVEILIQMSDHVTPVMSVCRHCGYKDTMTDRHTCPSCGRWL